VPGVREFAWLAPACHTEGATDARGTPRVRASLSAQPWCSCAMSSAPSLCLRVAKLDDCASCVSSRWDGARPCCCSNRVARARRSAVIRFAPGGDQAHHLPADALDLEAVPVVAGGPLQPEPLGEGFLQVLRDDRGDSADVPVVAKGVRGTHFPSSPVRATWPIWEWTWGCMSPSRLVCCSQCATARSASCHWPVSRPFTRGRESRCGCSPPRPGSTRTRHGRPARSWHRPR
jgi:hypothetical protein